MSDAQLASELLDTARETALAAADVIHERYDAPRMVYEKKPGDLVTDTDRLAQDAALSVIRKRHPGHSILAEEDSSNHRMNDDGSWIIPDGVTWTVDPIDGTSNFTTGLPFICVAIGAAVDGKAVAGVIYDPLRDEMFTGAAGQPTQLNGVDLPLLAERELRLSLASMGWAWNSSGSTNLIHAVQVLARNCLTIRALGSAALSMAYLAAGRVGLYMNLGLKPWDVGAAVPMIEGVGGEFRSPDGSPWRLGQPAFLAGHPATLDEAIRVLS